MKAKMETYRKEGQGLVNPPDGLWCDLSLTSSRDVILPAVGVLMELVLWWRVCNGNILSAYASQSLELDLAGSSVGS